MVSAVKRSKSETDRLTDFKLDTSLAIEEESDWRDIAIAIFSS